MNKRFRIVRPIATSQGTLDVNNTITILHGHVLYNDGPVQPQFAQFFMNLIQREMEQGFYHLREISFPQPVNL